MSAAERVGHPDQVALVTRRPALDVRVVRGIEVRLQPDRGLDVGWERDGEGVTWRATLDDLRGLRVERTVRTLASAGRLELADRVTCLAGRRLEAPVLYHVNLGWPLWDEGARVKVDGRRAEPRDGDAAPHDWRAAPAPGRTPERVWEHVGAAGAAVVNERLGLRVRVESDLPRLWQWVDPAPGVYALGLEPANCSVLGRAHDRAEGRLPLLAPGEQRTTSVVVTAEVT